MVPLLKIMLLLGVPFFQSHSEKDAWGILDELQS